MNATVYIGPDCALPDCDVAEATRSMLWRRGIKAEVKVKRRDRFLGREMIVLDGVGSGS